MLRDGIQGTEHVILFNFFSPYNDIFISIKTLCIFGLKTVTSLVVV